MKSCPFCGAECVPGWDCKCGARAVGPEIIPWLQLMRGPMACEDDVILFAIGDAGARDFLAKAGRIRAM